ncbi:protein FAM53C [Odontesthes bonariensis]|uniref:protein FAM53C n=1 Tax=Odontesthes bonariensis TaxID=219752 RepID=UPI003F58A0C2
MPESSYWQLCPPSKSGLQGALLSSSFPPGPVPLVPPDARLQEGGPLDGGPSQPQQHRPLAPSTSASELSPPGAAAPPPGPPPPPPPPPKRHCRSLSVPEDLSRCRYTWRPSASRVWTPVSRQQCHGGAGGAAGGGAAAGGGMGMAGGGVCPLRAPSSSLNSSLHSSSSPTFFSLALSPDSPLPWSFPWDPSEAAAGGGACCCFFPSPSSCSSSPSPLHPPPPQRRFSLSPVLIRDSAASTFLPPPPAPAAPPPPGRACSGRAPAGGPVPASPSSACSTPSSVRRSLPPPLPRCHSQPCDLLLLKPGLKRRRDPERPCARPVLDFTKMTQTRSIDPQALERGGRPGGGGDVCMDVFMGDFRGSCSPAECLGRTSIGPLSESDEECREDEEEDGEEREAAQQLVFERDCTELDLNLIEEN